MYKELQRIHTSSEQLTIVSNPNNPFQSVQAIKSTAERMCSADDFIELLELPTEIQKALLQEFPNYPENEFLEIIIEMQAADLEVLFVSQRGLNRFINKHSELGLKKEDFEWMYIHRK
jgi:hypothetical protein